MEKIAIIGAGISGLSVAHFLSDRYDITVFEKENRAGGLIRCLRVMVICFIYVVVMFLTQNVKMF